MAVSYSSNALPKLIAEALDKQDAYITSVSSELGMGNYMKVTFRGECYFSQDNDYNIKSINVGGNNTKKWSTCKYCLTRYNLTTSSNTWCPQCGAPCTE
jgi:hypothetical protein